MDTLEGRNILSGYGKGGNKKESFLSKKSKKVKDKAKSKKFIEELGDRQLFQIEKREK
jgi:hypothetical protein